MESVFLAHPVRVAPYTAIRFARYDHNRVPLFFVGTKESGGTLKAMRAAHARYGSSCYYCGKPMSADSPADLFTLDHVHAASLNGTDDLHNLVFCCRPCNEAKGVRSLAVFHPARSADFTGALNQHVIRALNHLISAPTASTCSDGPVRVVASRA